MENNSEEKGIEEQPKPQQDSYYDVPDINKNEVMKQQVKDMVTNFKVGFGKISKNVKNIRKKDKKLTEDQELKHNEPGVIVEVEKPKKEKVPIKEQLKKDLKIFNKEDLKKEAQKTKETMKVAFTNMKTNLQPLRQKYGSKFKSKSKPGTPSNIDSASKVTEEASVNKKIEQPDVDIESNNNITENNESIPPKPQEINENQNNISSLV